MSTLTLTIPGRPMGKPRMTRQDRWKHRPCVVQYREFCDRIRKAVGPLVIDPEKVLRLDWTATFAPPKSWKKADREDAIGTLHRQMPDRDNLDKAILDALFERDQAIAAGTLLKVWGWDSSLTITMELED